MSQVEGTTDGALERTFDELGRQHERAVAAEARVAALEADLTAANDALAAARDRIALETRDREATQRIVREHMDEHVSTLARAEKAEKDAAGLADHRERLLLQIFGVGGYEERVKALEGLLRLARPFVAVDDDAAMNVSVEESDALAALIDAALAAPQARQRTIVNPSDEAALSEVHLDALAAVMAEREGSLDAPSRRKFEPLPVPWCYACGRHRATGPKARMCKVCAERGARASARRKTR